MELHYGQLFEYVLRIYVFHDYNKLLDSLQKRLYIWAECCIITVNLVTWKKETIILSILLCFYSILIIFTDHIWLFINKLIINKIKWITENFGYHLNHSIQTKLYFTKYLKKLTLHYTNFQNYIQIWLELIEIVWDHHSPDTIHRSEQEFGIKEYSPERLRFLSTP